MTTYNTYSVLGDEGEMNDESTVRILQSVREKEDQFEQLTRDLEVERKAVSNQLEKYRLGSDTTTLSSISSTNDSFHWRPPPPDAILEEESDSDSKVGLIDSCLQGLADHNPADMSTVDYNQRNFYQHPDYSSSLQRPAYNSQNSIDQRVPLATTNNHAGNNDSYLSPNYGDTYGSQNGPYSGLNSPYRGQPGQRLPNGEDNDRYPNDRYDANRINNNINNLDNSVPVTSYAHIDNDSNSLDRYIPAGGQYVPRPQQRPYADYRGQGEYPPSESDRSSDHGAARTLNRQHPSGRSTPASQSVPTRPEQFNSSQQNLSRVPNYMDLNNPSRDGVPVGQYNHSSRSPSLEGYISRSQMNAVSIPNQTTRPDYNNPGYQPDSDYRPDDNYPSQITQPGPEYPNRAFEPEYPDRGYPASNDRSFQHDNDRNHQPNDSKDYQPAYDRANLQAAGDPRYLPFNGRSYPAGNDRQPESSFASKQEENGGWRNPDLQEVIDFLSHPSNAVKVNAAAHLQHLSFMNDKMKYSINVAGGIPPLVALLSHEMPEVQKAACGALRNLSFGRVNDDNKRAIQNADGLRALVRLLRQSSDNDIRELVTGILWNMSSCQDLKKPIIENALITLVESVIMPHSGWDPRVNMTEKPRDVYWTTVFRNTSGILRNVSSEGIYSRKKLRECVGLIESVINVLKAAIGKNDIDNKAVENLVCLLRNLSYACQETVDLDYLDKRNRKHSYEKEGSSSCFGSKNKETKSEKSNSGKNSSYQNPSMTLIENRGMQMLWHPSVVKIYQPILSESTNPETLEAAAGALQNLAACDWQESAEIRAAVRKEKCLPVLVELLALEADKVVRSAATALRNLAIDERNKDLIGKYAMRQLVSKLPDRGNSNQTYAVSDETIAAIEATVHEVIRDNIDFARSFFSEHGVDRLIFINENRSHYSPRVIKFTQLLLRTLWRNFNSLHEEYKKEGFTEQDFITKSSDGKSAPSAQNTLLKPQMNQGGSSYSQQTPQPITRHPISNSAMPPDYYRSPSASQLDRSFNDGSQRNDQIPMRYMPNNDNSFVYQPNDVVDAYPHPSSNNRFAEVDLQQRYAGDDQLAASQFQPSYSFDNYPYQPSHEADNYNMTQQPSVGYQGENNPVQQPALGSYQPQNRLASYQDDLAFSSRQSHHSDLSNQSFRQNDVRQNSATLNGKLPQQEPIYSKVSRPSQIQLPAPPTDSWV